MATAPKKTGTAQKSSKAGASQPLESKSQAPAPAPKASKTDWDAIERDYRTGKWTDGELATKHGIARESIVRRRKKDQLTDPIAWAQDVAPQVRAATNALLAKQMVAEKITEGHTQVTDTILVTAEVNKQVILGHRKDIKALRDLTAQMVIEVTQMGTVDLERIAVMLEDPDMTPAQLARAREELNAATRLPTRILSAQRLTQAFTRLQHMERQAFGLDDKDEPPPVDELGDLSDEELNKAINERIQQLRG
jgi:hypothetical protein